MAKITRIHGYLISAPFQRADRCWIGKYRRATEATWHQRRLPDAQTEEQARDALIAFVAELAMRDARDRTDKPTTFGAFFLERLGALEAQRSRSFKQYRLRWKRYIEGWFATLRWDEITPALIQRWIDWLRARTVHKGRDLLSAEWVHAIFSTLSSTLSDAVALELLPTNPCTRARRFLPPRKAKRARTQRQFLTVDEIAELLSADFPIKPALWRTEYAFVFFTARRVGEVRALRWQDLELDRAVPFVRVARTHGGDTTKNDHAFELAIHPQLAALLRIWRDEGFARTFKRAPRPEDFLFPHGKTQSPREAASALRGHLRLANLPRVTYHALRHSGATAYLCVGMPEKILQLGVLGHVPGTVTARYLHPSPPMVLAWMRRLHVPIRGLTSPDGSDGVPLDTNTVDTRSTVTRSLAFSMAHNEPPHTHARNIRDMSADHSADPSSTVPAPPPASADSGAPVACVVSEDAHVGASGHTSPAERHPDEELVASLRRSLPPSSHPLADVVAGRLAIMRATLFAVAFHLRWIPDFSTLVTRAERAYSADRTSLAVVLESARNEVVETLLAWLRQGSGFEPVRDAAFRYHELLHRARGSDAPRVDAIADIHPVFTGTAPTELLARFDRWVREYDPRVDGLDQDLMLEIGAALARLELARPAPWTIVVTPDAEDAMPSIVTAETEEAARAALAWMRGGPGVSIVLLSPKGELVAHAPHGGIDFDPELADEDPELTAEHPGPAPAPDHLGGMP